MGKTNAYSSRVLPRGMILYEARVQHAGVGLHAALPESGEDHRRPSHSQTRSPVASELQVVMTSKVGFVLGGPTMQSESCSNILPGEYACNLASRPQGSELARTHL
jgi:hypothetical protein